jgi:rhamnulokinase
VLDSLAAAYRRTLDHACAITGRTVEVLHLVGGGAQNSLLCQLTADACEIPVIAGPVEAAAYGNVLVQARALGTVQVPLADLRRLIPTRDIVTYRPSGHEIRTPPGS